MGNSPPHPSSGHHSIPKPSQPYQPYYPSGYQGPRSPQKDDAGSLTKNFAKKYGYIPDSFTSVDQVQDALRKAGLESSNLIVGVDFTKSNEWSGKYSFGGRNLHLISDVPNPYEQAITIIGKTLESFDDDQLIPCYGFGDATTHDVHSFSFNADQRPCNGFEEALSRYREITPHIRLAGPTSFAPIIEAAVRIVEENGGQYHVLLIIADGQVTRSSDLAPGQLSPQEKATVDAIVAASNYALSIVMVGVGDGPWDTMRSFDDSIPQRNFDNFQFVDFSSIMKSRLPNAHKEAQFALAALMEIPEQYKACTSLGLIGRKAGRIPPRKPLEPPPSVLQYDSVKPKAATGSFTAPPGPSAPPESDYEANSCPICLSNKKDMVFQCGHQTCSDCGEVLTQCPICRANITTRIKMFG